MTSMRVKPTSDVCEPPSPPADWWFGHLLPMRENPLRFLAQTARDYGPIVKLRFRKNIVYLVSEPDLIKELLIDHGSKYRKNTRYKHMKRALGQGLLLSEGDAWRAQRRTVQPFFTPKGIASRASSVAQIAEEHVEERWRPVAESGAVFDTESAFSRLTQRQVLQFIVGSMHIPVADALADCVQSSTDNWPTPAKGRLGSFHPPQVRRLLRLKHAIEAIEAYFYGFIDTCRESRPNDAGVLGAMMDAEDSSAPLDVRNKQLRDQLVTLFLAAFETSASSLCWTFYLLDQHPAVRDRVYDEIDRALEGRTPSVEDFPKLPYLDRVISESLRLYSPIHSLSRVALEDDTIGGFAIPKDSTVMVSLYATHRLPHHWPDPDRFDPDRFSPENSKNRHRYSYIPFAIGHRACIGGHQAVVNAKINIATIAQRYVLTLAPGHRVEPDARTTMRPKYGMMMTLQSR